MRRSSVSNAFFCIIIFSLLVQASSNSVAQRATENAVTSAQDAFGISVDNEAIGLYGPENVRGFSAIDAGNARLDGLYFDPVLLPSPRIQQSTMIRVGIASQGFAFPAPTGVVDYALRHPGSVFKASIFTSVDSYDFQTGEVDLEGPLKPNKIDLGVGYSAVRGNYYNGTTDFQRTKALIVRWRPTATLELLPFWSQVEILNAQASPLYVPAGQYLPPYIARRKFSGPSWAKSSNFGFNYGGTVRWAPPGEWMVQAGLFRSGTEDPRSFTNLYLGVTPDAYAHQVVLVDPPLSNVSTSGEIRVTHTSVAGPRLNKLILSLRGRDRVRRYGGNDVIDLGIVRLGEQQTWAVPVLTFTSPNGDRIKQGSLGLAYEGSVEGVGELGVSLQKTHYTKHLVLIDTGVGETDAKQFLYSAAAALNLTRALSFYVNYTCGLEDSGSAPSSAVNRNAPTPAIKTRQIDAGVRYAITSKLNLVAGVFAVRKPYFQLDADNRYAQLGDIENKGAEFSLSGAMTSRVDIVAGAVLSHPLVSGNAVQLGLVGYDPVDKPRIRLGANVNWRPTFLDGLTFEIGMTHVGRRAATTTDDVYVPARTLLDLGARYGTKIGSHPIQLRLAVTNLTNKYGFDLSGAGAYDVITGRVAQISLGADF